MSSLEATPENIRTALVTQLQGTPDFDVWPEGLLDINVFKLQSTLRRGFFTTRAESTVTATLLNVQTELGSLTFGNIALLDKKRFAQPKYENLTFDAPGATSATDVAVMGISHHLNATYDYPRAAEILAEVERLRQDQAGIEAIGASESV